MQKQKGVSLIVVFFIMTIILAIVLSITVMLYDKIKIIRNIGDSVVAYYTANSGIEKVIYFQRKGIPQKLSGGLCNICNQDICPDSNKNCRSCELVPLASGNCAKASDKCVKDCCNDCEINFKTIIDDAGDKRYNVKITTGKNNFTVDSYGTHKKTVRAIELKAESGSAPEGPTIPREDAHASPVSIPQGAQIDIQVDIIDTSGTGLSLAEAVIKNSGGIEVGRIQLNPIQGNSHTYAGQWINPSAPPGAYYVDITVCDKGIPEKKCTTLSDI